MLTFESRCLPVMGGGVLVSRTLPNRLNKVQEIWFHCIIFVKFNSVSASNIIPDWQADPVTQYDAEYKSWVEQDISMLHTYYKYYTHIIILDSSVDIITIFCYFCKLCYYLRC